SRPCQGKNCGFALNSCGALVSCGSCPGGQTCGANHMPNLCGLGACTPDNAAACAGKACGPAINDCGDAVTCPNTCVSPNGCGGGGAGPNGCGCTPNDTAACAGKACGPATNNCAQSITCPNTCVSPSTCGGGGVGPNSCGPGMCTPDNPAAC